MPVISAATTAMINWPQIHQDIFFMAEILLVRHGQASFGTDNYDQLSEMGYKQARLLGQHLVQQEQEFSSFYAGSLARQQQTAQGVIDVYRQAGIDCPALTINADWDELENHEQVTSLLPQVIKLQPELQPLVDSLESDKKSFQKILRAVFQHWIIEQPQVEGLESWVQAKQRFADALQQVRDQNGSGTTAAVFTSGGVIASVTAEVMQLGPESVYGLFEPVINASISRFIHSSSGIALSSFNEHQFLKAIALQHQQANVITYR